MLLVIDANVLIDYLRADERVLLLAARHLGVIHVLRDVVDEVDGLDDDRCGRLGLKIVEPTTEQLIAAGSHPRVALSFEDRLCLLVAEEQNLSCVTNDKALRRACIAETIDVIWGLELMIRIVQRGEMNKDEAVAVARAIHDDNPAHITAKILVEFTSKVVAASIKE